MIFPVLSIIFISVLSIVQINDSSEVKPLGKGSTQSLQSAYMQWENKYLAQQGEQYLTLALVPLGKAARLPTGARGTVRVDLYSGEVIASLQKGGIEKELQLWLQTKDGHSKNKQRKLLGAFNKTSVGYQFSGALARQEMQTSVLHSFIVKDTESDLSQAITLVATPSLFQKMFYRNKYWSIARLDHSVVQDKPNNMQFVENFLPKAAFASNSKRLADDIWVDQIAKGREIFINETFNGNGRTCSTCHRLDNNHTIDPKYIARLSDDDPLFIAEQNPALAELERPKLLRQFGLIQANLDGFDKPAVLRSVPHLLALGTSITPESEFEGGFIRNSVGWSADGAPLDGSLRSFTIGAIMQHMPKTLNREVDVDFRMPTEDELDALEAYMLSLGRSRDFDLDNMYFSSPIVQKGRELFHSKEPGTGQCKGCHFNAGANSSTSLENGNRNTGIEAMPNNLLKLVWEPTPSDGGYGTDERHDCARGEAHCYGNHEFNMTTVVEAADTGPYFHNNSVNTLEEAIAFYNSKAFHQSPGANPADPNDPTSKCGRCIHLEPTQITAIALFLRTLNAMENIRSSNELDLQATELYGVQRNEILGLAIADTEDAIEVLEEGIIIANPKALKSLYAALRYEREALAGFSALGADTVIYLAIDSKNAARNLMLKPTDLRRDKHANGAQDFSLH